MTKGPLPGPAPGRPSPLGPGQHGAALVLVLGMLVILAAIAGAFTREARSHARLAANRVEAARAEALADGGVAVLLGLLAQAGPAPWPAGGGVTLTLADGTGQVSAAAWDEGGKVDVNTAEPLLLAAVLAAAGTPPEAVPALVDAIGDFLDADDLRRASGAEAPAYAAAGRNQGPLDRPLETVEELALVLGIDDTLYRRLEPLVTVYTGQTGIDPLVAGAAILAAVEPTVLGTTAAVSTRQVFSLRVTGQTAGGGRFIRTAVARLRPSTLDSPPTVLSWRQAWED